MNVTRIAILGVALVAAVVAAMLVRGMLGGGTAASQASVPAPSDVTDILVASQAITPGHALAPSLVHWEAWPKKSISAGLITKDAEPDIAKVVSGMVVRAPLVIGQPITEESVARAGSTGFLAATIGQGMRGIGVTVNAQTGAGGFILPNNRVDVVVTRDMSDGNGPKDFQSFTVVRDVRVLAVDQTAHMEKDEQSLVAKTATLELTPEQAEMVALAQQTGIVSLTLRSLGDSSGQPVTGQAPVRIRPVAQETSAPVSRPAVAAKREAKSEVTVLRYGVVRGSASASGAGPSPSANISSDLFPIDPAILPNVAPAPLAAVLP